MDRILACSISSFLAYKVLHEGNSEEAMTKKATVLYFLYLQVLFTNVKCFPCYFMDC